MSSSPNTLSAYQYRLLAVLALINFVNFGARQVFVPLIPLLRGPLGATDDQLGTLQAVLYIVLAAGSISFGFFADRFSRKLVMRSPSPAYSPPSQRTTARSGETSSSDNCGAGS